MAKKKLEKPMSQTEYIKNGGSKCSFCGSEEIEGEPFEANGGTCNQDLICLDCDSRWSDEYVLKEYIILD